MTDNYNIYPFASAIHKMEKSGMKPVAEETAPNASLNLDAILTPLIQAAGRFTEQHTTDFLISWNSMESFIRSIHVGEIRRMPEQIFVFGIRELGVDGNQFAFLRIRDLGNSYRCYYRRLYAVRVYVAESEEFDDYPEIHVELWDIRNGISIHDFKDHDAVADIFETPKQKPSDEQPQPEFVPHPKRRLPDLGDGIELE